MRLAAAFCRSAFVVFMVFTAFWYMAFMVLAAFPVYGFSSFRLFFRPSVADNISSAPPFLVVWLSVHIPSPWERYTAVQQRLVMLSEVYPRPLSKTADALFLGIFPYNYIKGIDIFI